MRPLMWRSKIRLIKPCPMGQIQYSPKYLSSVNSSAALFSIHVGIGALTLWPNIPAGLHQNVWAINMTAQIQYYIHMAG